MGTRTDEREYGPSWADVLVAMEELQSATGRGILIEIGRTPSTTRPSRLYFRLVARERRADGLRPGELAQGAPWPHVDFKTVPALLLHLCHLLDRCFAAQQEEAEGQARF